MSDESCSVSLHIIISVFPPPRNHFLSIYHCHSYSDASFWLLSAGQHKAHMRLGTARASAVALCCSGDRLSAAWSINMICRRQCSLTAAPAAGQLPRKPRCERTVHLPSCSISQAISSAESGEGASKAFTYFFALMLDAMIKSSIKGSAHQKVGHTTWSVNLKSARADYAHTYPIMKQCRVYRERLC